MTGILAVAAFGLLFVVFGFLLHGEDRAARCAGCDGTCGSTCREQSQEGAETDGRRARGEDG